MIARDDIEHFHAWAKIVFGHPWSDDPPPDYAKIQQEVARLLGSGKPILPFAEKWLADLRTPRRPGQGRECNADFLQLSGLPVIVEELGLHTNELFIFRRGLRCRACLGIGGW